MLAHFVPLILIFMGFTLPIDTGQTTLTLEEAISRALKSNPDILLAQRELEAAQGKRIELRAFPEPDLIFSQEGLRAGAARGEREITLGVEQLIEFPGKRTLRTQAAAAEEEALAAELQCLKLLVGADVKKAYFRAVHSQMVILKMEELLDVLEQYQEMARIRFQAGQVSSVDVLRGRLESLRVRGELIEAKRRHRENMAALALILGDEMAAIAPVAAEMDFTPLEKNLPTLQAEVVARPCLRAASFRLTQSERELQLAEKSSFPDFVVGLYYPSLRTSSWGFSVGVSIPLWRDKWKGQTLRARAASAAAATALEARKRKILTLLEVAYADVRAIEERLALFEKSLLGEVDALLELAISQYPYGQIDSLNLFDIYKFYKTTQLEHLDALLAHKIALAELETVGER